MRPKVILQLYPVLPSDGEEGRMRERPLGRSRDLYQQVLFDWLDIVKAADEMGVWGASTIEHHLHSEGYEVGPNPGILNAWWAGQVKNIHVGALGYVMATQDPIRVAEETAILDHSPSRLVATRKADEHSTSGSHRSDRTFVKRPLWNISVHARRPSRASTCPQNECSTLRPMTFADALVALHQR
jgi:hypothetical protein